MNVPMWLLEFLIPYLNLFRHKFLKRRNHKFHIVFVKDNVKNFIGKELILYDNKVHPIPYRITVTKKDGIEYFDRNNKLIIKTGDYTLYPQSPLEYVFDISISNLKTLVFTKN